MSDDANMPPETSISEPPKKQQKVDSERHIQLKIDLAEDVQKAIDGEGIDSTDDVLKDLICPICMYPAFDGVVTRCQHVFHSTCLGKVGFLQRQKCPLCKLPIDMNDEEDIKPFGRILSNLMGKYKVQCPQGKSFDYYARLRVRMHACV